MIGTRDTHGFNGVSFPKVIYFGVFGWIQFWSFYLIKIGLAVLALKTDK